MESNLRIEDDAAFLADQKTLKTEFSTRNRARSAECKKNRSE
jgi:hypothetical protein